MGIGPSTKETTLHRIQDPLAEALSEDTDVDFLGVLVVGTPQDQLEKLHCSQRVAKVASMMRVGGAVVSCDGWGNSHLDFVEILDQLAKEHIPTVGVTFQGTQGTFVVPPRAKVPMVDVNKTKEGIESEVVGENTTDRKDARLALALLKLHMRKGI
ncbi:hypothetical protein ABB02_01108 [Clostridiaceae bacterium JG1575]|nr:hypothetical protein ABB02_01108 [Clostridiaceae bacterium JG1575]